MYNIHDGLGKWGFHTSYSGCSQMLKRNGLDDTVTTSNRSKPQVSFSACSLLTWSPHLISREGGITGGLSSLHLAVMYNNVEILKMLTEDKRIDTSQIYSGTERQ